MSEFLYVLSFFLFFNAILSVFFSYQIYDAIWMAWLQGKIISRQVS